METLNIEEDSNDMWYICQTLIKKVIEGILGVYKGNSWNPKETCGGAMVI